MKKYLLVLAIALLSISANAQLKYGVKAGVNFATITGDAVSSADNKTGFVGGVFVNYAFNDMISLQPEVLYSMEGAKGSETIMGVNVDETLSYDYIEIPVLVKFNIPLTNSTVAPYIYAGPEIGINVKAEIKAEASGYSEETMDLKDYTKSTQFSAAFGAGVTFPVSSYSIGIDFRYNLGLTKVPDPDADQKNSVMALTASFTF